MPSGNLEGASGKNQAYNGKGSSSDRVIESSDVKITSLEEKGSNLKTKKKSMDSQFERAKKFLKSTRAKKVREKVSSAMDTIGSAVGTVMKSGSSAVEVNLL